MILADTSDAVQIATLFFGAVTTIVAAWIGYLTLRLKSGQAAAAVKVEDVAATLQQHTQATDKTLGTVVKKVDEVHLATNGLTERLVDEVRKAATLQGGADERARADAEKRNGG